MAEDDEEAGTVALIRVPRSEWVDLKRMVAETRDSSLANKQTLDDVVRPKLQQVADHEVFVQRARGGFILLGILWTIVTVSLSLWLSR